MTDGKHEMVLDAPQAEQRSIVHPLVARAMEANPNTETLRELMAMQKEWEAGEARKAYTRAIVALKEDLPTVIAKDATVDFTSQRTKTRTHYTHTSLAKAMAEVTPALTDHGFSLAWVPSTEGDRVSVTCRLTHSEGHFEECTLVAPRDVSGNKSPAQGIASTITLLQRYTALSLLGIATADMTDPTGEGAEPAPDHVDATRNLKAVGAIQKRGLDLAEAAKLVGRQVPDWTTTDLDKLRGWIRSQRAASAPSHPEETGEVHDDEPPERALASEREPGED